MNKWIGMGRLTKDPDVHYTQGQEQKAVAKFTLAVDRGFKKEGEQSADFISCVAFGKLGEFAEKYLKKGTKVVVEGRWQTGSYVTKTGEKVYTNDCVLGSIEFAESKKADAPQDSSNDFVNIPENLIEELPFS